MKLADIHEGRHYLIKVPLPGRPVTYAQQPLLVVAKSDSAVIVERTVQVCVNRDEHADNWTQAMFERWLRYEPRTRHDSIPARDVIGPHTPRTTGGPTVETLQLDTAQPDAEAV